MSVDIAEAVQVFLDICQQDLLVVGCGFIQLAHGPFAGVEEDITRCLFQWRVIQFGRFHLLTLEFYLGKNFVLGWLQQRVQTAQNHHGQDNVSILAANINIAQAIICNRPDKRNKFVVGRMVHSGAFSILYGWCLNSYLM